MSPNITIHFISHSGVKTTLQGKTGKSLMEVATAHNLDGLAADCGGLMTCATCHVFIDEPDATQFALQLAIPDAEELAMLAFTAVPRSTHSRLSCQVTLTPALEGLTVKLPSAQY